MQEVPTERFVCSTASAPSPSSTTLRTRRRSRTSSVAGESSAAGREERREEPVAESRAKGRLGGKCSARAVPGQPKSCRKPQPAAKSLRPSTGVLQNAIVLAPFHTLKRCFQNKLVDLYSYEKMKKINRKLKMAEKQKISFEYDIVELNRIGSQSKKEAKGAKRKQKLRSPSYCQCNRELKAALKDAPSPARKPKEPGHLFVPNLTSLPGPLETKRRKLNPPALPSPRPDVLKAELSPRPGLYSPNYFLPSDTNCSGSRLSSRSKSDSSETCSNSASCRDERLTGSLAISTTSFDSCLEQFDNPRSDCSPPLRRALKRTRPRRSPDALPPSCLPKPHLNSSRHLIIHVGTKTSDSRIVDFMDREPQTQLISSAESARHLHPLPRRQTKPPPKRESAPTNSYYLRSLAPAAEPRRSPLGKGGLLHVEVATQVESAGAEQQEGAAGVSGEPQEAAGPPCEEKAEGQEAAELSEPGCELVGAPAASPAGPSKEPGAEAGREVGGGPAESCSFSLLPELGGRFEGPGPLEQPQDKDASFIFGPTNTASRLGDSCKFSFGLNLVFSDDDD